MVRVYSSGSSVEIVDNSNASVTTQSRAVSRCTKNVDWILSSSSSSKNQNTGCRSSKKLNPNAKPFVPCNPPSLSSSPSTTTTTENPNVNLCNDHLQSTTTRITTSTTSVMEFVDINMEDDSDNSSSAEEAFVSTLQLKSGAASIPHPAKKHKGGEDAHFISADSNVIGVADGVGGWEALGVDSGLYSRSLMNYARISADTGNKNPSELLKIAHERCVDIQGSTTACIISIHDNKLHAANLGDSGFLIIRNGSAIYKTKEQQHYFNCPYQIGSSRDVPEDAQKIVFDDLQSGDIILAATDGVFDNLFTETIVKIVKESINLEPSEIAQRIASTAHTVGCDPTTFTPFQDGAQKTGQIWQGGKLDDITCIVAKVSFQTVPVSKSIGA